MPAASTERWLSDYKVRTFFGTFVDRPELAQVREILKKNLERLANQDTQHVSFGFPVVFGGAGVGKTTLVRQALATLPTMPGFSNKYYPIEVNLSGFGVATGNVIGAAVLLRAFGMQMSAHLLGRHVSIEDLAQYLQELLTAKYPEEEGRFVIPIFVDEMQAAPSAVADFVTTALRFNIESKRAVFLPVSAGIFEVKVAEDLQTSRFQRHFLPLGILRSPGVALEADLSDIDLVKRFLSAEELALFDDYPLTQCVRDCGRVFRYLQALCEATQSVVQKGTHSHDKRAFAQAVEQQASIPL